MTLLSGVSVPALIGYSNPESIVSVRRFLGLLFASNLVWLLPLIIGSVVSSFTALHASLGEFVFGAFLAWGFQLVIINGAFVRSIGESLVIAGVQPVLVLLAVTSFHPDLVAVPLGSLALLICLIFLLRIKRVKTKTGTPSLDMLRAFLKTWVGHEPAELEGYFSSYAEREVVETSVLVARGATKSAVLVLPGIHPGPFSPVGSYNLSELIYQDLKHDDTVPVVLHGTGGHERNVPTNELASEYAKHVSEFVSAMRTEGTASMRGPVRSKVGVTNVTTLGFGKDILTIITNAPYRSDDLDPSAVASASEAAAELGLNILTVDAHNSVNGQDVPQPEITHKQWKEILAGSAQVAEKEFRIGAANSAEVGFKSGGDVSDGGISVVVFADEKTKSVLVSADSNNAVSGLRETLAAEVKSAGMELIDLCTSDTHKLAARNLTKRGYFALGEYTKTETIVELVRKLLALADGRLEACHVVVSKLQSELPLIGSESLDDFAAITKEAISFSKRFVKLAAPVLAVLLAITLFY